MRNLTSILLIVFFAVSIQAQKTADNTLSAQEQSEGWTLLFDGKSMDQWVSPATGAFPTKGYSIENGVLIINKEHGNRGGDIMTKKRYTNFEFSFDFWISKNGNNGIKYYYQTKPDAKGSDFKGPEYQILDDMGHPDANLGFFPNCRKLAALYDILPPRGTQEAFKGPETWNTGKIVAKDGKVEHWLNGVKVLEYDRFSYVYEVLRDQSKFKNAERFGQFDDGHLLITEHEDHTKFKNLKVREL